MSIQPSESSTQAYPINAAYQSNAKLDVQANKTDKTSGQPEDAKLEQAISKETLKTQTQASLIQHLFGEGAPKNENALRILYQETVDKLNEVLAPDLGPNAISAEKLAEQGGMDYWSPENTAARIVQGTTAMFDAFKAANSELEHEAALDRFLEVIGGGIEQGFQQATDMLKGFGVFDGSIKDNADKTYQLVQQGLQDFRTQQLL
jgi:hypothetical protein